MAIGGADELAVDQGEMSSPIPRFGMGNSYTTDKGGGNRVPKN